MKKNIKLKLALSAAAAFIVALLLAAVLLFSGAGSAALAEEDVTYEPVKVGDVFNSDNIRGAKLGYSEEYTEGSGEGATSHRYLQFEMGVAENVGSVSYRKNLAYSWKVATYDSEGNYDGGSEVNRFNMEFAFPQSSDFERFIIRFQSQQYKQAKDNITQNFLIFTQTEAGKIRLAVTQDEETKDEDLSFTELGSKGDKISLSFGQFERGNYPLVIKVNGAEVANDLQLVNVFEAYSNYQSSGDYAVTPLKFSATFADVDGHRADVAKIILYSINGQSFEVYDNDGDGSFGWVKDTAAPVMCFPNTPSYIQHGKTLNFDGTQKTIDVIVSSPKTYTYYYVLTGDQYGAADYDYNKTYEQWNEGYEPPEGETSKINPENPYTEITTVNSDKRIVRDKNTFVPASLRDTGKDYTVYGLIKLYYQVSDLPPARNNARKSTVYLDWYVKDADAMVNIHDVKGTSGTANFLKIIDGKEGVTLATAQDVLDAENGVDTIEKLYENRIKSFTDLSNPDSYQSRINSEIAALKDKDNPEYNGKLYGGGDNRFYLPAIEYDFMDEYCTARDYKYSIYYQISSGATNSSKSLSANKLSIPLNESNVTYYFKVYITDAFGNKMRYPVTDEDTGEIVWKEIPEDKIWADEYREYLPEFTFRVDYKPATSKNPDIKTLAYVGSSYSGVSFSITGVSGTYKTAYDLFILDRAALKEETGYDLSYLQVKENFEKLLYNNYDSSHDTSRFFSIVKPASLLNEKNDEDYELHNAIGWNATSVSFTPQSTDEYYIVRLTLTDTLSGNETNYYAVVSPSVETTAFAGEEDWAEDNTAAIVLLCIAGVFLAALVVVLLIRPKEKGDIDEIVKKEEDKKSRRKEKKAKAE